MKAPAMDSEKPIEPDIAELIRRLEERLLLPEVRRSARRVGALLAEEFREIGSSGRIFDRQQIIDQLRHEPAGQSRGTISDFTARELSDSVVLTTYRVIETRTLRSSIWKNINSKWQMVFHQGTRCGAAAKCSLVDEGGHESG
jgi:hypothetical protein